MGGIENKKFGTAYKFAVPNFTIPEITDSAE